MCSSTPLMALYGLVVKPGRSIKYRRMAKDIKEVANTGGFILGIAFSPDCSWLAVCDLKNKCVWKLDTVSYSLEKFATGADGASLSIPNYAVFDSAGKLYVSDSGAFRQVNGKIFCFDTDGSERIWHNGPLILLMECVYPKMKSYCTWCAHGYPQCRENRDQ